MLGAPFRKTSPLLDDFHTCSMVVGIYSVGCALFQLQACSTGHTAYVPGPQRLFLPSYSALTPINLLIAPRQIHPATFKPQRQPLATTSHSPLDLPQAHPDHQEDPAAIYTQQH